MAIDRRKILQLCGCGVVGLAAVDTFVVEPGWLDIVERDVPVPKLPTIFQGLRIAHLSDVHLKSLGRLHDSIFAALLRTNPQLVVLTGDSIEEPEALKVLEDFCRSLAQNGREVVATIGNWEHWGQVDLADLERSYNRAGVRLLGNESRVLKNGLSVIATDDDCSGHADVRSALRNAPADTINLFLTHAPGLFDKLPQEAPSFALGLAGHTHGGQVRAFGAPLWVPPGSGRFTSGSYETAKGPIYVSRGIGTSILSARFTCRPELPILRLIAA